MVGPKELWQRIILALRVIIDDDHTQGWQPLGLAGDGPNDRDWNEHYEDLTDALEAWEQNFLVRQVVRLTTAFVVGDGLAVRSSDPVINDFIAEFWAHEENDISARLSGWCDELTRSGELFLILFTDPIDGLSFIREMPASQIERIVTDPDDYEKHLGYREIYKPGPDGYGGEDLSLEPKIWASLHTAEVSDPMMLHYKVNRVIGRTRGTGDLGPVLPWAKRYVSWLKGRVRFNDLRSRLAAVDIEIDNDRDVPLKQAQYEANPPTDGSIWVHGRGERISYPAANIQGWDAEPDGRAIRLALAAGANVPIHFLGEGSQATRSTAEEMGDPTRRHYRMRQQIISGIVVDIVKRAYGRRVGLGLAELPEDWGLVVEATDISKEDNKALAEAALTVVNAFSMMRENGWIDDETAVRLSFKFVGELLDEEKIQEILDSGVVQAMEEEESSE